jgi:hypothetical protein
MSGVSHVPLTVREYETNGQNMLEFAAPAGSDTDFLLFASSSSASGLRC